MQGAQGCKYFHCFAPEHSCRTIDCKQVRHIELSYERHAYFAAVYFEQHSLERHFEYPGTEIGHRACGICFYRCRSVLHHYHAVFIVAVGNGKSRFRQSVEEGFLGVAIIFECLVIIQMVARKIRKNASCEYQSPYPFLRYAV